jgi:hypothetical protein
MAGSARALAVVLLVAGGPASAQEEDAEPRLRGGALLDLRAAHGSGQVSWLDSGLGKTRYGARANGGQDALALGQASLVADATLTEILGAHVQLNLDADPDPANRRARLGLVEAFATFRPEPSPRVRLRFKGGMFFPAISLEHTGKAWSTVHTITPSAINAWVGEEVRATGLEATVAFRPGRHELSATAAVFSNNDPAGTLLSWRGWALHDRQTAAFDELPLAPIASLAPGGPFLNTPAPWDAPIREIDGRLGYYAGAGWSLDADHELRAMFWDNNADPAAFDGFQYGWYTEFWSLGARAGLPGDALLLAQYMDGTTEMGDLGGGVLAVDNRFRAAYALVTAAFGRHRVSGRYDWFDVEDRDRLRAEDPNDEDGHAWTAAYLLTLHETTRLAVEWLRVSSTRPSRADLGLDAEATETQVQASVRLTF